jgi:cellulose synthase/poly-beta-1,6-N-acetylglucosamine synthase-like glycosyltransferase
MIGSLLFDIYTVISSVMLAYGLNFYYLTYRSTRNRTKPAQISHLDLPRVTIQLPVYNERYVAKRLIESVCQLEYPHSKLEVQVLDDSTDDTVQICKETVQQFLEKGINLVYIHRDERAGFKAGALQEGLSIAVGEFVAIFDADFIPPPDFLTKALPYFASKEVGMVQTRWGHLNEDYSTLTKAQALSLDAHFLIEQKAKSYSELFMNFNGTAGIWRRNCILDAGGWQDTLAEDLDLSYRAQLKGWKFLFLDENLSPAEIPVQMNASRKQQFRWAKGSAQCVKKFFREIVESRLKLNTKLQALFQLTRHVIFPFSIIQLLLLPFLISWGFDLSPTTGIVSQLTLGPLAYVYALRKMYGKNWPSKIPRYMFLLLFGEGISLSNSIAFFEGLVGAKCSFERTPKYGIQSKRDTWREKKYRTPFSWVASGEIALVAYGVVVILIALIKRSFLLVPNIAVQTLGFLYVSGLTIGHSIQKRGKKNCKDKPLSE